MKTFVLVLAALGLLLATACGDDPTGPPPPVENPPQNLTQRSHVLDNIEYAYNTRRLGVYDDLLNADFVFYFSSDDVGAGTPESWNRAEDLEATERLFLSNQQTENPPADPVCRSMRLDLVFDEAAITWVEVQPPAFPTETWYAVTVFYTATFEIEPNTTYITQNGAKAEFTVRNAGTDQYPHWELVEFRDLGSTFVRRTGADVSEATWGSVKALYSPSS